MPGPVVEVPYLVLVLEVLLGLQLLVFAILVFVLEGVVKVGLDLIKVLAALVKRLEEGVLGRHGPQFPGPPSLFRLRVATIAAITVSLAFRFVHVGSGGLQARSGGG